MAKEKLMEGPDGTEVGAEEHILTDEGFLIYQYVASELRASDIAVPAMVNVTQYDFTATSTENFRTDPEGNPLPQYQEAVLIQSGDFPEFRATVLEVERLREALFTAQPNLRQGKEGLTSLGLERTVVLSSIRAVRNILGELHKQAPTATPNA
jgi:hypothetical protein